MVFCVFFQVFQHYYLSSRTVTGVVFISKYDSFVKFVSDIHIITFSMHNNHSFLLFQDDISIPKWNSEKVFWGSASLWLFCFFFVINACIVCFYFFYFYIYALNTRLSFCVICFVFILHRLHRRLPCLTWKFPFCSSCLPFERNWLDVLHPICRFRYYSFNFKSSPCLLCFFCTTLSILYFRSFNSLLITS